MNEKLKTFLKEQENLEFFRKGEQYLHQAAKEGRLPEETPECSAIDAVECFLDNTGNTLKRFQGYLHLKFCDNCRKYASICAEETDVEQQYATIVFTPSFKPAAFAGSADASGNVHGVPLEMTVELPIESRSVSFIIKKQLIGDGNAMRLSVSPFGSEIPQNVEFCYNLFKVSNDQVTPYHKDKSEKLNIVLDCNEKFILFIGDVNGSFVEINNSDMF